MLDHLADLESDLSVFHGIRSDTPLPTDLAGALDIDQVPDMTGPHYFRFAARIFAYDGVMTARLVEQQENGTAPRRTPTGRSAGVLGDSGRPDEQVKRVSLSELSLEFGDVTERVEV